MMTDHASRPEHAPPSGTPTSSRSPHAAVDLDAIEAEWKGVAPPYIARMICGDGTCDHFEDGCDDDQTVAAIFDYKSELLVARFEQFDDGLDIRIARAFAAAPQHLRDLIAENRALRARVAELLRGQNGGVR